MSIIHKIQKDHSREFNNERVLSGYNESIRTLSDQLYAQDHHFLFELIQNADDNLYSENTTPSLTIELQKIHLENFKGFGLIVSNNEDGFTEENISAICNTAHSTKKNMDSIGEKGIGFKSVFRVTDTPYIFSNNYYFKLPKVAPDHVGYITPFLVEKPSFLKTNENNTILILPLNRDDFQFEDLSRKLKELNSDCLLFLRKLRKLDITIHELNGEVSCIKLTRVDNGFFRTIAVNNQSGLTEKKEYYVFSQFYKNTGGVSHQKRQNIGENEVEIAIKINQDKQSGTYGSLFTYLPVWENTGLPFHINSDFLLTASREDLLVDLDWNKWIRGQITETYINSILSILHSDKIPFEQKLLVYNSIPLNTNKDFLQPVVSAIQQKLKETEFIFTFPNKALKKPSEVFFPLDGLYKIFKSSKKLPNQDEIGYYLIHEDINLEALNKRLMVLSLKNLSFKNLIKLYFGKSSWVYNNTNKWYSNLYLFLEEHDDSDTDLSELEILKIEDYDSCFSSSDGSIFYEFHESNDYQEVLNFINSYEVDLDLYKLDSSLFKHIEAHQESETIKIWLSERLNVLSFSEEALGQLVFDYLSNAEFYEDEESVVIQLTKIVGQLNKKLLEQSYEYYPLVIKDHLTGKDKVIRNNDKQIVVPSTYKQEVSWVNIFSLDERGHFLELSDQYGDELIESLRSSANNVQLYPTFPKREFDYWTMPLTACGQQLRTKLRSRSAEAHVNEVRGYEFIPLHFLKESNFSDVASVSFLVYLNYFFLSNKNFGKENFGFYMNRGQNSYSLENDIPTLIRSTPWLITNKGFVKPREAFVRKKEIEEIFGEQVPYIEANVGDKVWQFLGVQTDISRTSLITYLTNLIDNKDITQDRLIIIYDEISRRTNNSELPDEFFEKKIIALPKKDSETEWVSSLQCVWNLDKTVPRDGFYVITDFYKNNESNKNIFTKTFKIKENLDADFYLGLWKELTTQEASKKHDTKLLTSIYNELKDTILEDDDFLDTLNGFFERNEVIYSPNRKAFFEPDEVYLPDDLDVISAFKREDKSDQPPLAFIPEKDGFAKWQLFYERLGVKSLRERTTIRLSQHMSEINLCESNNSIYITKGFIFTLAAFIKTNYGEIYQHLLNKDYFKYLLSINEYKVEYIRLIYDLYQYEASKVHCVHLKTTKERFYLLRTDETQSDDVAKEIFSNLKLFVPEVRNDVQDKIEIYLSLKNLNRIKKEGLQHPHELDEINKRLNEPDLPNDSLDEEKELEGDDGFSDFDNDEDNKENSNHQNYDIVQKDDESPSLNADKKNEDKGWKDKTKSTDNTANNEIKRGYSFQADFPTIKPPIKSKNDNKNAIKEVERTNSDSEHSSPKHSERQNENLTRDVDKEIERLQKDNKWTEKISELRDIIPNILEKFNLQHLLNLIKIEDLMQQDGNQLKNKSIIFDSVDINPERGAITLDSPNRFVSSNLENYQDVKLFLFTKDKTIEIPVDAISVSHYQVRAKVDVNSEKLVEFAELEIFKSKLELSNATSLWTKLGSSLSSALIKPQNKDKLVNTKLTTIVEGRKISFIFGPPGTGKTTTIVDQHLLKDLQEDKKVLVLTPTNKAADVIAEKLIDKNVDSNFYRFGTTGSDKVDAHSCFINKTLPDDASNFVFCTTIARFCYDHVEFSEDCQYLSSLHWDKVIIDEASMINLAEIINVIMCVSEQTEIIIAGDPFQIKPILNEDKWKEFNIYDLVDLKSFDKETTGFGHFPVHRLMTQYRSVEKIGKLVSSFCYGDMLESERKVKNSGEFEIFEGHKLKNINLVPFQVSNDSKINEAIYLGKSSIHIHLALFIVEWLQVFTQQFESSPKSIGIICPYRGQSDLMYKLIRAQKEKFNGCEILVSTVHGFQGDECDIIVCAFNPPKSFSEKSTINDKNVINVALSRARDFLVLLIPNVYLKIPNLYSAIDIIAPHESSPRKHGIVHSYNTLAQFELGVFGTDKHIEENTFVSAHQNINVYGSSTFKYEVRLSDDSIDVQISD